MEDWRIWLLSGLGLVGAGVGIYFWLTLGNAKSGSSSDTGSTSTAQPADGADLNTQLQTFKNKAMSSLVQYFKMLNQGFGLLPTADLMSYTIYSQAHMTTALAQYYFIDNTDLGSLTAFGSANSDPKLAGVTLYNGYMNVTYYEPMGTASSYIVKISLPPVLVKN